MPGRPRKSSVPTRDLAADERATAVVNDLFARWSKIDQETWATVYPADPLLLKSMYPDRPPGPVSQKNTAYIVDVFNRVLAENLPHFLLLPFAQRLDGASLLFLLDHLVDTATECSIRYYLDRLILYAERYDPTVRTRAFRRFAKQFKSRKKGRGRRPDLNSADIFWAAEARLKQLEAKIRAAPIEVSEAAFVRNSDLEAYRNVLVVAWLSLQPLRLRNLIELEIGESFKPLFKGYWVDVPAEAMKGRRALRDDVPRQLWPMLRFYLDVVRPRLAPIVDPRCGRVLISHHGLGYSPIGMHQVIKRISLELIGESLSAHQFRYVAADTAASVGVKLAELADVLQHVRLSSVTEGYQKVRTTRSVEANRAAFSARLVAIGRRQDIIPPAAIACVSACKKLDADMGSRFAAD